MWLKCKYPLTPTEDSNIWYPEIDGCGLLCNITLISTEDQTSIQNIVWYAGLSVIIFLSLCLFTFRVDWKSANRYPSVGIYYLSICLFLHYIGWMVQFFYTKQSIVCRHDNTRRYSEPGSPGSALCILVFFLIYYFGIAALIWLVIVCYLWYHKLKVPKGNFNDLIEKRRQPMHVFAWSIPFALTVMIILLNKIDSYPMLGICFVSSDEPIMQIFVWIPIILCLSVGIFNTSKTMHVLIKAKSVAVSHLTKRRKRDATINRMLIRLGIFWCCLLKFFAVVIYAQITDHLNSHKWKKKLDNLVLCSIDSMIPKLDPNRTAECEPNVSAPSLSHLKIQLFVWFSVGFTIIIWLFTRASWEAWRRFFLKKCDAYSIGRHGRKHEMLAKAYKYRRATKYNQESLHGDPVDMNLTSATSQEISTEWLANFPKFLQRRAAITSLTNANHYLSRYRTYNNNNNSSISDTSMQQGLSCGSMISNHQSLDSQASIDIISRHVRRKTKKERVRLSSKIGLWKRRGSDSSIQSNNLAIISNQIRSHDAVTRATSTGDLQLPGPSSVLPACSYLPSSFPHPTAYPVMSPTFSVMSRPRTDKPPVNHPFTHGMSQQGDSLINPLQERRRPDSSINGSSASASQQNANLGVGYLNSFNCTMSMSGQPLGPFANPNLMVNGCGPPNGIPNYFGFSAPTPFSQQPPTSSLYNPYYPLVPCAPFSNGASNLDELQSINRAREACLPLITGVDTCSEDGEKKFLPIAISDSEGFTDGGFGPSVSRTTSRTARRLQGSSCK
ncbi:protein smoothened [Tetranychus urticae]|uniref:G-protein coupled receptors family 2 profile 2 domain-containing protein n=1 Tax=Tetranychus urticae TaxID=32264 RepID=T1KPS1_TETUR|nr:protein smoothened [Tetranychus urticae]